jgi:hypothetical protein
VESRSPQGFGAWKERFMHDSFAKKEEEKRRAHLDTHIDAQTRWKEEFALERKLHNQTRSDMVVK